MTEIVVTRTQAGFLVPFTEEDSEKIKSYPIGVPIRCKCAKMNSGPFHRLLFSLFNFAYENWNPLYEGDGSVPNKSFNNFRKELTVQAGYYEMVFRIDGTFTLEAKSLQYGKMSDHEKKQLYNDLCQVVLDQILPDYTIEDLQRCVDEKASKMMGYL